MDDDSILEAFPPVPGLIIDSVKTPESSLQPSEDGDAADVASIPIPPRSPLRNLEGKSYISTAATNSRSLDPEKLSSSSQKSAPQDAKKDSKQSPKIQEDPVDRESYANRQQLEEWSKVTQFMELMQKQDTDEAVEVLKGLEIGGDRMPIEAKYSNEQALAALEFGSLDNNL